MWVRLLNFNALIGIKDVPKGLSNWFCIQITFWYLVKTGVSIRNILFTICIGVFELLQDIFNLKPGFNMIINGYCYKKTN